MRIKRKSIAMKPVQGGISDTLNIEDKVKNAPSINLVEQMTGIPQEGVIAFDGTEDEIPEGYEKVDIVEDLTSELTDFNSKITGKSLMLIRNGRNYNLIGYVATTGSKFTIEDTIFKIPLEYCPLITSFNGVTGAGNSNGSASINSTNGIFKVVNNLENSGWIGFNISWIR